MHTTIITALLLLIVAFASPDSLSARARDELCFPTSYTLSARAGDELCFPTSYTLSNYKLLTSRTEASVHFSFKSFFADGAEVVDAAEAGVDCNATGATIPNSNECQVAKRRLLFDLRAPQNEAKYQITHTWTCNGATWMSSTAVIDLVPQQCTEIEPFTTCLAVELPQTFAPQNVRKICSTPTC